MSFKVECNSNTRYLAKLILRKVIQLDRVHYRRVMIGEKYNKNEITEGEWKSFLEENNGLKNEALKNKIELYYLRALINKRQAKNLSQEVQDKWLGNKNKKKKEKREVPKGTPLKSEN